MTWTYSGDPSVDEKDKYRFLIGDTNAKEPILQDAEIQYVISEHSEHNTRLYLLYDRAADFFARKIKRTVGPIEEDPIERQKYFAAKAAQYKMIAYSTGFRVPTGKPSFRKGMHDNGGY